MIRSVNQLCRLSVTYNNSSEVKLKIVQRERERGKESTKFGTKMHSGMESSN